MQTIHMAKLMGKKRLFTYLDRRAIKKIMFLQGKTIGIKVTTQLRIIQSRKVDLHGLVSLQAVKTSILMVSSNWSTLHRMICEQQNYITAISLQETYFQTKSGTHTCFFKNRVVLGPLEWRAAACHSQTGDSLPWIQSMKPLLKKKRIRLIIDVTQISSYSSLWR